ncbi:hypothetical protein [Pseudoalteromonas sp. R3]|jgi:phage-related tail protein|uniref:hypothetical protein n=1 Tax=Pseudoalteromonas sp. R3 TaxID=1709477 RepID=UPI0006B5770E|nr:hypothetical protein [Pseudoalteromonas sp. R3]AZZ97116.1 hypothetical protein ELR70_08110 [Pseudoalteromonas sp. R3]
MRKQAKKTANKGRKVSFEEKLEKMVNEYRQEKESLASLNEGTSEYQSQLDKCNKLFANVERFLNRNR